MSSTALLVKMLGERMEVDSAHGREVIGVLLFQDLAVVPRALSGPDLRRRYPDIFVLKCRQQDSPLTQPVVNELPKLRSSGLDLKSENIVSL